ncbi:P-loop containing nucleoside triphosphate hydrolase protein, partial [Blastocladiella britannica]
CYHQGNICFHAPCDTDCFTKVIDACALTRDLEILDGGDATQIGEKGVALSGGQKQRVSLARAAYARDTDVIVLDDVLSAVDAPTAVHLITERIRGEVIKECILVTHNIGLVAPHADFIVYVKDGRVVAQGDSMDEVIQQLLVNGFATEADTLIEVATPAHRGASSFADKNTDKDSDKETEIDIKAPAREVGQLIKDGGKAIGGWATWAVVIAGIFVPQLLRVMQDWWLKTWAQSYSMPTSNVQQDANSPKVDLGYYAGVYIGLCLVYVVAIFGASLFQAFTSMRAALSMHAGLLKGIHGAPISFFDSTPTGRLIKRFSHDVQTMAARCCIESFGWVRQSSDLCARQDYFTRVPAVHCPTRVCVP